MIKNEVIFANDHVVYVSKGDGVCFHAVVAVLMLANTVYVVRPKGEVFKDSVCVSLVAPCANHEEAHEKFIYLVGIMCEGGISSKYFDDTFSKASFKELSDDITIFKRAIVPVIEEELNEAPLIGETQ